MQRTPKAVAKDGRIVTRSARRNSSIEELVARITPRNRHPETIWGRRRGKEAW